MNNVVVLDNCNKETDALCTNGRVGRPSSVVGEPTDLYETSSHVMPLRLHATALLGYIKGRYGRYISIVLLFYYRCIPLHL